MRAQNVLAQPVLHAALINVLANQHHKAPHNLEVSNTTLVVPPLPGGPGIWDIAVDLDAVAVIGSFRSQHGVEIAGAVSGVAFVANRDMVQAASISLSGDATLPNPTYCSVYAKAAAGVYLSHKIFDSTGQYIAFTDVHLYLTGPSTRVLRTTWTNLDASNHTLHVRGEILVFA